MAAGKNDDNVVQLDACRKKPVAQPKTDIVLMILFHLA